MAGAGGEVVVGDAEAGGLEGDVAEGCDGHLTFLPVVWVCRVFLLLLSPSKAVDPIVGAGVGFMCQCLGPVDGEDAAC